MISVQQLFGFYPYAETFRAGAIQISPIPDIENYVREVLTYPPHCIDDGWFYPPIEDHVGKQTFSPELLGIQPTLRTKSVATRYGLLPTHTIERKATASQAHLHYLIACFGLFVGMRLVPYPWGHFYKTPIYKGLLSDVVMHNASVERAMLYADHFWKKHRKNTKLLLNVQAAIHSFHQAECHEYPHEKYIYLCMCMDTVLRIYQNIWPADFPSRGKGEIKKWEFPRHLCKFLDTPCPRWARKLPSKDSTIAATLRNTLVHEGIVNGQPFGFSIHTPYRVSLFDINLEMVGLINRALFHSLGVRTDYTKTAVTTRQQSLARVI